MTGIALRVASGPGVGLGHVARCRSLAEHLPGASFVSGTQGVLSLVGMGIDAERITSIRSTDTSHSWLCRLGGVSTIVFDSLVSGQRAATEREVADAVASGYSVIVIDSMPPDHFEGSEDIASQCDMVISPYLGAERFRPRPRAGEWVAGARWSILSSRIVAARSQPFPLEPRILIACGGTDPESISLQTAEILGLGQAIVDVVIGPDFSNNLVESLAALAQKSSVLRLHYNVVDMLPYYLRATVVVGRPGLQRYEVAALGRTGIYFWDRGEYLDYFKNFVNEGVAEFYFGIEPLGRESFINRMRDLTNQKVLKQLSHLNRFALEVVDVDGVKNVAKKVLAVNSGSHA